MAVDTGVDGTYSVIGLAPGDYYVTFRGETYAYRNSVSGAWVNTSAFLTQSYPNIIATTAAGPGTPVHVTLSHVTTGINDVAALGSTFSGIVTDAGGAPLLDICVLPANADGYVNGVTQCSDSSGRYTTAGLPMTAGTPTGTYHLVFLDYESRYLIPQWYDSLLDTLGQHSTATPLVTRPGDQTLKTVVMQRGGDISGVATASGRTTPLANVYVTLFPTGSSGPGLYGAQTDSAGRFITQSVPPGSYKVGFIDYSGAQLPANTYFYYNNAQTLAAATAVTVTQGQTTALGVPTGPTAPSAPTAVSATAGDGTAAVTFAAPASNGGSPITGYTITPSPPCSGCTGLTTTGTSSTVHGLTNGTAYTFTVTAANGVGPSPASAASTPVTPKVTPSTVPTAPTAVAATPGDKRATVTFVAPASNGGSPITRYTVTAAPGGRSATTTGATTATVLGLTNGTAYTFRVTATNAAGTSPASLPSAAVTPRTPGTPTLSGTVTANGVPVGNTRLNAYTPAGAYVSGVGTDASGAYQMALPPGSYKFYAYSSVSGYPSQWVGGLNFSTATVTVFSATTTQNIALHANAVLSGTVTLNGVPIVNAWVKAYTVANVLVSAAGSNAAGAYQMALPPGSYKLLVISSSASYPSQWAGGSDFSTATVTVFPATATQNIALHP